MAEQKKIVILGIGNEILTDDGIACKVVKYLEEENPNPEIFYETNYLGGLEILDFIQDYRVAIFIDATMTKDGIPGTIYEYTPENYIETLHLSNFHDSSFINALEFGRKTGMNIPESIFIFAIEIIEDQVFNTSLSPGLQGKYSEICDYISNSVNLILKSCKYNIEL